jgi:methionyl-tRNA formyltransferase
MRVVFVAPEEPLVMPVFFGRVLPALEDQVAAVAVVSPIYKRWSWLSQARRFIDAFGVRDFLAEGAGFARLKAADALWAATRLGSPRSVGRLARRHSVPVLSPEDVNGEAFLEQLRALAPDLVVSVSCPQIFGRDLLSLPRMGCINVHSALLPHHRGMLPTFWALAEGESHTGVTVHYMSPGIDGGDIITQRRIAIEPGETLHSLMATCKREAAEAVLETVARLGDGSVATLPNPPGEGSYHSFPTRADVARFRARGGRMR